MSVLNS